jgi:hypothetical protein
VYSHELARAIDYLTSAGIDARHIHAYLIIGHPRTTEQQVEESMRYANSLGIRVMLSEFAPIPGTLDGEMCRGKIDLNEPLLHNKTAFTMGFLGPMETQRLKDLAATLNRRSQIVRCPVSPGAASCR